MFMNNTEFKGDLSVWDVKSVKRMASMFQGAGIENSGIRHWNTASLELASGMFEGAKLLSSDLDLSKWSIGKLGGIVDMFKDSALIDGKIGQWDVRGIETEAMRNMLSGTKFIGKLRSWPAGKRKQALIGVLRFGSTRYIVQPNLPHPRFGTEARIEENIRLVFADAARAKSAERAKRAGPECTIM
jgi:hypothetical protein